MRETQKIANEFRGEESPTVLLYDSVTHHKVLVSEEELVRNAPEYYSYKVYEGIGANPSVGDWLKRREKELENE